MKIGIDARFYGPYVGGGGLGRYTHELLKQLQEIDTQNRYLVFLNREGFDAFQPKSPNFEKRLADVRWYTLAEQLKMPRIIDREHLDLIHYPHWNVPLFSRTPFVTTIHDLILLDERDSAIQATTLPRPLYNLKRLGYRIVLHHALFKSRSLIAVSNFTKSRILAHFPRLSKDKVKMIYEGGPGTWGHEPETNLAPKGPYFLYVGNAYPHKNLESLLHAFSFFQKAHPEVKLVLVGREGHFYNQLKKELEEIDVPSDSVIFTGFVPDASLSNLYQHATLYLFPSRHEGFGLPPLEAMAHGVPVAASKTSSLPEILGDAALYFDPDNLEDMVRVMETALSDETLRQTLTQKGYEKIKAYSWRTMAQETLNIYLHR
ncbi:MAG: glycosyl transferase, group 1 [Candidatus Giovannonibacteria bacterium GW2011_GWA2_53_7]|uniref:Glycosyl transferase, group 1 n=1 Tax=Candidatus Giovannonibacteria bacterium GW2011_GWA2_53_7 TaxID=1618650 RepID=A0A0G1XYS5_9BACT|nr:MAG: glycosyl transferase, group 1 [Candidatus Giovannonibacteria bacterium GW2011_GWA2_53_7]